tara:strand:- start:39 stop:407 length:369 start_codon:yes stop_codon:yes gene_type:complete
MGRKKEPNSWRSKGKGDCFTTKGGAVVCEGSKGMNYKPKGKKKSVAEGTRIQTAKGKQENSGKGKRGQFKITGTGEKTNSKGKKYKTIKIEPIGKGKKDKEKGRKFVKEISEKTYQKDFVRI